MIQQTSDTVEFKGTGQGLRICVFLPGDLDAIKRLIQEKLDEKPSFFKGATLFEVVCQSMTEEMIKELEDWLVADYGMRLKEPENLHKSPGKHAAPDDSSTKPMPSTPSQNASRFDSGESIETHFIQGTLRSGQRIDHPGDVVVLGDVNPGAEIEAGGNIVVMGSLRGIAHAGLRGNPDAFVAALQLQPTQLRIHQTISRSPDEIVDKSKNPEIARLKDAVICVESFLIRNRDHD